MRKQENDSVPTWTILLAFAALYLIWGSTYLGIKVAIETIPPFLMATGRFLLAGVILYAFIRWKGAPRPSFGDWKHAAVVGGFLIAGGNGVVSFAEKWIDSSMAALIIASNPLFMTLFGWWGGVQAKPSARMWLSLLGGFAGVGLLIGYSDVSGSENSFYGYMLVVLAVVFWTTASVYSKRKPQTISVWLQSGMQMIAGGFVCMVAGLVLGEFGEMSLEAVSMRSWVAFTYLTLVGSLAGFTSYVYLLKHQSPSAVASHAYVNPVVAVLLGWLVLGETLTVGGFVGSGLILLCVYELLRRRK